jgi:hypothetical protein
MNRGWIGITVSLVLACAASTAAELRFEQHAGSAYGLDVIPPWNDGGKLAINLPEHIEYQAVGMGILRHSDKEPKGHWKVADDGKTATLDVESTEAAGVRVKGVAKVAAENRVEISMEIINGSKISLPLVKPLYCHQYRLLTGFPQWTENYKHTYVVVEGKIVALSDLPTKDPAAQVKGGPVCGCSQLDSGYALKYGGLVEKGIDAAVAAVTALDGKRKLVIAWTPGKSFLSNANIPCIHADPYYGTIEPGKSAEAKGIIVFTEGALEDTVNELLKQGTGAPPAKAEAKDK